MLAAVPLPGVGGETCQAPHGQKHPWLSLGPHSWPCGPPGLILWLSERVSGLVKKEPGGGFLLKLQTLLLSHLQNLANVAVQLLCGCELFKSPRVACFLGKV